MKITKFEYPGERPSPRPAVRTATVAAAVVTLGLAVGLAGCSGTVEESIDRIIPERDPLYRSSKRLPALEVPPDLSSTRLNDRFPVPESRQPERIAGVGSGAGSRAVSYNEGEGAAAGGNTSAAASSGLLPVPDGVEMRRSGSQRWLLVDAQAEEVWPQVKEYFLSEGLVIASEDPLAGILETDWAEQRSAMSSGFISRLFNNLNSTVFGPATRDRFRARLERGEEAGTTEVYISHRGAEEVVATDRSSATRPGETAEYKVWQPRPSDPDIEAAVLSRLMVFIGVDPQTAEALVASTEPTAAQPAARARIVDNDRGDPMLVVDDAYDRAWRRTGLALDRVGFTVEDRDRSQGRYYVRYIDPEIDTNNRSKGGFISGLAFWRDDDPPPAPEYQVALADQGPRSIVMVLDQSGSPEQSDTADRILALLEEQLR